MHENREISSTPWKLQGRSAKAINRNADVHVLEKSDCAVVPVNRPNKEEQSSAEVGEGRAWIVENIPRVTCSRLRAGNQHVPDSRRVCGGLATPSLVFTIRAVCVNALARICAGGDP